MVPIVKTGVYDTVSYRRQFRKSQGVTAEPGAIYDPLRRFSNLLVAATAGELLTAVAHVFLGFADNIWASATCAAVVAGTSTLVCFAVMAAKMNLNVWLEHDGK